MTPHLLALAAGLLACVALVLLLAMRAVCQHVNRLLQLHQDLANLAAELQRQAELLQRMGSNLLTSGKLED
jgi:hypothetical protein